MSEAVVREVANPASQAILTLLAVEPSYPRRIGALLGLSETEVARRLRRLERHGLVAGKWGRQGKNVKLYRLAADSVTLRITKSGMEVQVGSNVRPAATPSLAQPIPADEGFIGREAQLATLAGPDSVVLVLGMPGIGKTSLLAHFARSLPPERVFWRSLRGIESLPWLANQLALFLATHGDARLLDQLGAELAAADLTEVTLAALDTPGFTFVIDEAHHAEDPAVRTFLAEAVARVRSAKLVVASREWITHNPARPGLTVMRLPGLPDAQAAQLLEARGVPVAESLRARLRDEVGGHPLGLQLLAQAARQQGLEALLDRVPEHDLEAWLLQEMQDQLDDDERVALSHASLLRSSFSAADLAAVSKRRLDTALSRLRRRMLVAESGGAHQLHEVVQNFFYSRLEDKRTLHARAAAHFLGKGTIEGRLEAMHHLVAAGDRAQVLELLEQNLDLREFAFVDAGYQRLYLAILGMFTKAEVRDVRRWGLIQDEKADIALHSGEAQAALPLYEEALGAFRQARDPGRCADASWKVGLCLQKMGRADEARATCEAALAVADAGTPGRARLEELLASLGGPVAQLVAGVEAAGTRVARVRARAGPPRGKAKGAKV